MKHTPGPWAIGGELISHNDIEIATVMHCYAGKTGNQSTAILRFLVPLMPMPA